VVYMSRLRLRARYTSLRCARCSARENLGGGGGVCTGSARRADVWLNGRRGHDEAPGWAARAWLALRSSRKRQLD
jgi:hypothetical protein